MLRMGKLKPKEQLEFYERALSYSDLSNSVKVLALDEIRREKRLLNEGFFIERLFNRLKVQKELDKKWEIQKKNLKSLHQDDAFDDFRSAITSGLLEIHSFKAIEAADIENKGFYADVSESAASMVKEFIQVVGHSISDGSTYPLFDNGTQAEIQRRIDLGTINVSALHIDRSKHVRLAGNLLEKLPLLGDVPMHEIIDIRRELETPLVRFRSALIKYSEEIKSAPWEKDFEIEADRLFIKYVGPAIEEIAEGIAMRSSFAGILAPRAASPLLAGGGILFFLDKLSAFPSHAALALGGIAAAAGILHGAYKEWQDEGLEIEKNQLYFYSELTNRLS
jgi:hypothetical protein